MDWFSKVIIFVDALKGVFQQLCIILIIIEVNILPNFRIFQLLKKCKT